MEYWCYLFINSLFTDACMQKPFLLLGNLSLTLNIKWNIQKITSISAFFKIYNQTPLLSLHILHENKVTHVRSVRSYLPFTRYEIIFLSMYWTPTKNFTILNFDIVYKVILSVIFENIWHLIRHENIIKEQVLYFMCKNNTYKSHPRNLTWYWFYG